MKISKEEYFKRQTTLKEFGKEGQELLQRAKVLIIGCGGLGNPISIYLATSGVGNIHIADFDVVTLSNLHRQVFYKTRDIGKPKAEVLANEIKSRAPFTKVTFSDKSIDEDSLEKMISQFDIIIDATDNLKSKYLINDACVSNKKPMIYGSVYKFDGYVATFNVKNKDGSFSANLRDAFPNIASEMPNNAETGILNQIVGITAMLQVNEVVKLITKKGKLLTNQILIYNALENSQFKMKLKN